MSEPRHVEKMLVKVKLTEADKAELTDEWAEKVRKKDELEIEKKQTADGYNRRIKEIDQELSELAAQVVSGMVDRVVEVYSVRDYRSRKVLYYRVATNELVDTRKMSKDELQRQLPIERNGDVVSGPLGNQVDPWSPLRWSTRIPLRTIVDAKPAADLMAEIIATEGPIDEIV